MSVSALPPDAPATRPALLRLLCRLGWQYVAPEACRARRGDGSAPLLVDSLLRFWRSRRVADGEQSQPWSVQAQDAALRSLRQSGAWGEQNRALYQMLKFGVAVQELLPEQQVLASRVLPLIDWQQPGQNIFEVSPEFVASGQQEAIDLVCFVNGLPLCLIHVQDWAASDPVQNGIRHHLACQSARRVPSPYYFAQLLVSLSAEDGRFGPVMAGEPFWRGWYEELWDAEQLRQRINRPLPSDVERALPGGARHLAAGSGKIAMREPTMADQLVIGLLTPERLIDYLDWAVVTEQGQNHVRFARSHQYFAVKAIMARLSRHQPAHPSQRGSNSSSSALHGPIGERAGGVVWHSAGSGKSLTMVFLLQALRRDPQLRECRVIVVTDRVDLEDQLANNFLKYGATAQHYRPVNDGKLRVRSGKELAQKIGSGSERLIFTMLHKFNAALLLEHCRNPSDKIIVLVDEAHRSHGGQLHDRMRRVFKRAGFVAFTGTPLLKQEKTRQQFGSLIHSYPMQLALQQRMVTPLWYEERRPQLVLAREALERHLQLAGLDPATAAQWRARLLRPRQLSGALARIRAIADDIALHFHATIKQTGSGLKGMVAVGSRADAVRYHYFLQQTGLVSCAIIMSAPQADDEAELGELGESGESGELSGLGESGKLGAAGKLGTADGPLSVGRWWQTHVGKQQAAYEAHCLKQYSHSDELDLLIVVDRLLTGFDSARAAVLYLDKSLQGHSLIQAISRINRLHPAKTVGLLVDYRDNLRALDAALLAYQRAGQPGSALRSEAESASGYDLADLQGLYEALPAQIARLPQLLQQVCDCFPDGCTEQLARCRAALQPEPGAGRHDLHQKRRSDFFGALRQFETCLRLASHASESNMPDLAPYRQRLAFFTELAQLVQHDANKAQGSADLPRQLADHVVQQVTIEGSRARYQWSGTPLPPSYPPAANAAHATLEPDASPEQTRRAAALLHTRLTKRITVELDDDPYAQQVFAERLQQEYGTQQDGDPQHTLQVLQRLEQLEQQVLARQVAGVPGQLYGQPLACACYGLLLLHEQVELLTTGAAQAEMLAMVQQIQTEFATIDLPASGAERNIFRCVNFALFKWLGASGALAMARRIGQLVRQHAGLPPE